MYPFQYPISLPSKIARSSAKAASFFVSTILERLDTSNMLLNQVARMSYKKHAMLLEHVYEGSSTSHNDLKSRYIYIVLSN